MRLPQAPFVPDELRSATSCLAFNRGFTRGYLFGDRGGNLMARDRRTTGASHRDRLRVDRPKGTATVRPVWPVTLHPGDGLLFPIRITRQRHGGST